MGIDKEFTGRYWTRPCRRRNPRVSGINLEQSLNPSANTDNEELVQSTFDVSSAIHHEPMSAGSQMKTVQIENLKKKYGETEVIRGFSVSMYEKTNFLVSLSLFPVILQFHSSETIKFAWT